jgi:hypothetical protein
VISLCVGELIMLLLKAPVTRVLVVLMGLMGYMGPGAKLGGTGLNIE